MTKIIKGICGVLTVMFLLASCMKSNDNSSSLYNDTAITGFSLGTLNRYLHTKSSTGADSVYKVSVSGSDYKFSIDHLAHRIFNPDSLPVGTDVSKVLCTVSALNNGSVYVEDLESEGVLLFYSDSLDFTVPRVFRVYSSDGSGYESYTVEVNVHQQESEQFVWTEHSKNSNLAALEDMKAVIINHQLMVFGLKDDKTVGYTTVDGDNWETLSELTDKYAYFNMVTSNSVLYTLSNGKLIKSDDGIVWEEVADASNIVRLVAASYLEVFGLTSDGVLMALNTYTTEWTEDAFEAGADLSRLPNDHIAYICYPVEMTYYADYVLLAGISPAIDKMASVWRKIVEYDVQGEDDKWIYMERNDGNQLALPQLQKLVMMYYDNSILAWGINDNGLSPIYQSRDNGLIWKVNSRYKLPEEFNDGLACVFGAATDGTEIWLVGGDNGEVWTGHLNRLAWEKDK